MPAANEGALTLTVSVRVSPEPAGIEFLKTYRTALNHAINKILNLNLRKQLRIYTELYTGSS